MRIIAGDFKGRRLESPENNDIRPTTDKVKEALFSIISAHVYDGVFVDLFSGTGNLGLEALSRGAAKCYFGDNSRQSIGIIKRNIEYCKAKDRAVVYAGDYLNTLDKINDKVDVFILDPPYEAGYYEKCFEKIRELDLLDEDGIIVAEHRFNLDLPEEMSGFVKIKERKYSHIVLSIYADVEDDEDEDK